MKANLPKIRLWIGKDNYLEHQRCLEIRALLEEMRISFREEIADSELRRYVTTLSVLPTLQIERNCKSEWISGYEKIKDCLPSINYRNN